MKVIKVYREDINTFKPWIGLVSPCGCIEYNAKFVLGEKAEILENSKWYTNEELAQISGIVHFLRNSSSAIEKNIKKWRCEYKVIASVSRKYLNI